MKICVLGASGMLGHEVLSELVLKFGPYDVCATVRSQSMHLVSGIETVAFNPLQSKADLPDFGVLPKAEWYINAIGVIKPFITNDPKTISDAIYVNSFFPWKLSEWCYRNGSKLIHITTDCVYSGKHGYRTEGSAHDCLDIYGKTKSLGEPNNCMVIRTSIIGNEIHKNASLVEWVKSNAGKTVKGFTNHLWNGITTTTYGKICSKIIEDDLYSEELFHVFSDTVTKAQLVREIGNAMSLNLTVEDVEAAEAVDRTLGTTKKLCEKLEIPTLKQQIAGLAL